MKKVLRVNILVLFVFMFLKLNIKAEVISINDVPNGSYVIGKYMFTRNSNSEYDGSLTTKLIMLASTTIEDNTIDNMMIYYKNARGKWIDGITGEIINTPEYFDIINIDLEGLSTSIIYDANGDNVANMPTNTQKNVGKSSYISATIPTREGYEFIGWTTDKYSSVIEYNPNDEYSKEGTLVLYAIWKKKVYTVTYNLGENNNIVEEKEYGADVTINNYNPIKDGYDFLGWNTKTYISGEKFSLNNNIDLYAVWKKKEFKVKINVINGTSSIDEENVKYGESLKVKLTPFEGYSYDENQIIDCENAKFNNNNGDLVISNVEKDLICDVTFVNEDLKGRILFQNNLVKDNDLYYFSGDVTNNYIKFANMSWRIVSVSENDEIKLVLQNGIYSNGSYKYSLNEDLSYNDSNIKHILDNWYDEKISDYNDIIINSDYCEDEECNNISKLNIGTLTLNDIKLGKEYLYNGKNFWTMTHNDKGEIISINNNNIIYTTKESLNTLRPVITIKNIKVSGNGTINNPYIIK